MNLNPTPALLESIYWITILAVIVSSASGVLKAGFAKFDLFGVIFIAITTGLGGGSVRDVLLDREVFWIENEIFFTVSLSSAIVIFVLARTIAINQRMFLIPDAAGLATFGIAGTLVSLMAGAPWFIASFMGVTTGVLGGIFRDVLCNEHPVVFQSTLYATVLWVGSLLFILLLYLDLDVTLSSVAAGLFIFVMRLVAIYYNISLPKFRFKEKQQAKS